MADAFSFVVGACPSSNRGMGKEVLYIPQLSGSDDS